MPLQGFWVINPGGVGKVSRAGFDFCRLWYVTTSTIIFSFHTPFEGLSGGKDLLHRWNQSRGGPKPEGRAALPAFEYFLRVRGFSPLAWGLLDSDSIYGAGPYPQKDLQRACERRK